MEESIAMRAFHACLDGESSVAYALAKEIPFPSAIDCVAIRALLLARYGTAQEALPAIGQYGAMAARQGLLSHMFTSETLAFLRVALHEKEAHLSRLHRISSSISRGEVLALSGQIDAVMQGAPQYTDQLAGLSAVLTSVS